METNSFTKPDFKKRWQVIYTRPRWEKKVDQLLQMQGIESYCPVRKVVSQWADRKKVVEFPVFNSYVFVKINWKEEHLVRQTLGVLNFIYYMGKPAIIRDNEISEVKQYLESYPEVEVVSLQELSPGDRVSVKSGIFQDKEGHIIEVHGKSVLMVFDKLDCALVTKVETMNLTLIN